MNQDGNCRISLFGFFFILYFLTIGLACTCLYFSSHNSLVKKALVTLYYSNAWFALITVCFIVLFAGEQSLRIYRSFSLTVFCLYNFCSVNSFILIFVFAEITMSTQSKYLVMEALPNPSVHRTCMSATISGVQKRTTTAAERQRHIQIRLRQVKCFAIILCGSRFVPNKRNVLSLAWHESLSCKGKNERFTAAGGVFIRTSSTVKTRTKEKMD